MSRLVPIVVGVCCLMVVPASRVVAQASSPRPGWQATLSTRAHNTSGVVTIVDQNTFRVDNFFYDGGGIDVHFILAASDDVNAFRTNRVVTDLNLLGTPYSGGSLTIDLPTGATFDGYNAVSLWCIPARANFGSGTFLPIPEPTGAVLFAGGLVALRVGVRRARGTRARSTRNVRG